MKKLLMVSLIIIAAVGDVEKTGVFAFKWKSSSLFPNGTVVQACVGDNVTFPWVFDMTSPKQVIIHWSKNSENQPDRKTFSVLASYNRDKFYGLSPERDVEFLPNAGIKLPKVTLADKGVYMVEVILFGHPESYQQIAFLHVSVMESREIPAEAGVANEASFCFLIIGKTGNGKSTVGNALLGKQFFQVGVGLSSTTTEANVGENSSEIGLIKVIDTPDIFNMGFSTEEEKAEIDKWRKLMSLDSSVVLVAVRCDVRYTAEEHNIYLQIKSHWGDNSLCEKLVVLFTFGDRQDGDLKEELKSVCPELKSLLHDANNRYVLYNRDSQNNKELVNKIQDVLKQTPWSLTSECASFFRRILNYFLH